MKICRFSVSGRIGIGRVEGANVRVLRGDILNPSEETRESLPLAEVKLLSPVMPGKIIGIGRNYAAHARELGNAPPEKEPLIFLKPPSAILDPGGAIVLPRVSERIDHEGELGVVIGRPVRNIPEGTDPLSYVLGYTCVNDVTARDLQKKDVQFTRAKGYDTFCPVGPYLETELDPSCVRVQTRVNGQVRQDGNTSNMIFPVHELIRYLSSIMTLLPGDLIATGTPAGVGPLFAGDFVEIEVEGIGILGNTVIAEPVS